MAAPSEQRQGLMVLVSRYEKRHTDQRFGPTFRLKVDNFRLTSKDSVCVDGVGLVYWAGNLNISDLGSGHTVAVFTQDASIGNHTGHPADADYLVLMEDHPSGKLATLLEALSRIGNKVLLRKSVNTEVLEHKVSVA